MFRPRETPMERGWVGRVDGERVVHLAAQTLQSFFLGGGGAREHAEYRLGDVVLLAPVLQPPTVRLFEAADRFVFGNATAVQGPGAAVASNGEHLTAVARLAAVIGAGEAIGGFTAMVEWRRPSAPPPKRNDFALLLGPVVVTPDELDPASCVARVRTADTATAGRPDTFPWEEARAFAMRGTSLRPGDVLAGPPLAILDGIAVGPAELQLEGVGALAGEVT